jgi:hypothetical protein
MIRNNVFYNINRGWPVQIYPGKLNNIFVLNNTFATANPYNNGQITIYRINLSNSRIENNIFHQPNNSAITVGGSPTLSNVIIRNNITTAATMTDSTPNGISLAANKTSTDPMLINPSGFDFHLRPGSPAIDAGMAASEVVNDYEGRARPQGAGHDIGAFEFSSAHSTPRIRRADVKGKKLFVYGDDFEAGAVVLLNGENQKTSNGQDSQRELKCKKAGKKIAPGQTVTLKVRNTGGLESDQFIFTRPPDSV